MTTEAFPEVDVYGFKTRDYEVVWGPSTILQPGIDVYRIENRHTGLCDGELYALPNAITVALQYQQALDDIRSGATQAAMQDPVQSMFGGILPPPKKGKPN